MNTLFMIICLISTLSTAFVSCFHAWLDYKKQKEKDAAWDAAVQFFSHYEEFTNPIENFADFYAILTFIRNHPKADYKSRNVRDLMREASESDKR